MRRDLCAVLRDQLTPVLGAHEARVVANTAEALSEAILDSHISRLEGHQIIPAVAAILGHIMHGAAVVKAERDELIGDGVDILSSLYPGHEQILAVVAATNAPDPKPNAVQELMAKLYQRDMHRAILNSFEPEQSH